MYKKLINDLKGKKYPTFHVKTELKIKAELSDALSDADFELSELKIYSDTAFNLLDFELPKFFE